MTRFFPPTSEFWMRSGKQPTVTWGSSLDFANSLMGGDEQFNAQAVQRMFAHAWNIAHVKDAEEIRGKRETVSLSGVCSGLRRRHGIAAITRWNPILMLSDPVMDTKHLIEQSLPLM